MVKRRRKLGEYLFQVVVRNAEGKFDYTTPEFIQAQTMSEVASKLKRKLNDVQYLTKVKEG